MAAFFSQQSAENKFAKDQQRPAFAYPLSEDPKLTGSIVFLLAPEKFLLRLA